jgi:predicted membrane protein
MKKENLLWGILLILGGMLLIVSKLGYLGDVNSFNILVAAVLAVICVKNLFKLNFYGILFPIAFIGILFDKELGITALTPWTILIAALLGSIGLSLIFGKGNPFVNIKHESDNFDYKIIDIEDEKKIRFKTSFGASIKYINSEDFQHAELDCKFGSMKVYFDNAIIQNGKAIVRLNAAFSGIELFIPNEWKVENQIHETLSGLDEKNKSQGVGNITLTLVGNVSFSGIEIIYI